MVCRRPSNRIGALETTDKLLLLDETEGGTLLRGVSGLGCELAPVLMRSPPSKGNLTYQDASGPPALDCMPSVAYWV